VTSGILLINLRVLAIGGDRDPFRVDARVNVFARVTRSRGSTWVTVTPNGCPWLRIVVTELTFTGTSMPEKRLKELLEELRTELKGVDGVDDDVMESLDQLEVNIDDLVDPDTDSSENSAMDDAIALETRFAANFPVAEQILREVINTLNRIGI